MDGLARTPLGYLNKATKIHASCLLASLYNILLVLSAMSSSLVHGGNDVGNCIGPVVLMYLVYKVHANSFIKKTTYIYTEVDTETKYAIHI